VPRDEFELLGNSINTRAGCTPLDTAAPGEASSKPRTPGASKPKKVRA
jgi:hypothetical protein